MKKDFDKLSDKLENLQKEVSQIENLLKKQSEQLEQLKKAVNSATMVKIEENGKQTDESYGNLILDEIISLKKKLEGFSAEGLRGVVNDVAAMKNRLEAGATSGPEFSLSDLKAELLKLADMMS